MTAADPLREAAFRRIEEHYRNNHKRLFIIYGRSLGSWDLGREAVQEAYTKALTYYGGLTENTDIDLWLGTILRNTARDVRRIERNHGIVDYAEEEVVVRPSAIPAIILKEVIARINAKAENVATILRLFLVEGYRTKEIARKVPESNEAIRKIVERFRRELREEFNWSF